MGVRKGMSEGVNKSLIFDAILTAIIVISFRHLKRRAFDVIA